MNIVIKFWLLFFVNDRSQVFFNFTQPSVTYYYLTSVIIILIKYYIMTLLQHYQSLFLSLGSLSQIIDHCILEILPLMPQNPFLTSLYLQTEFI